jgi:hypothetical protein
VVGERATDVAPWRAKKPQALRGGFGTSFSGSLVTDVGQRMRFLDSKVFLLRPKKEKENKTE